VQAVLNYEELLSGKPAIPPRAHYTLAQHIMQTEREAVLCQSIMHSCAASAAKAGARFRRPLIVGVVGEAHVEGIAELWEHGKWQSVLAEAEGDARGGKPLMMISAELTNPMNHHVT
jgi:hypothetical protein